MIRFACLAALLSVSSACGLIDSDIADFDLTLPEKDIMVDTMQWQLTDDAAMPSVPCAGMEAICSTGIDQTCGADGVCFGSCDGTNCQVKILIALFNTFDLAQEKPELQDIEGQPLVSVTIEKISISVTENTFNVQSPPFTIYAAPQGVMVPGDPLAQEIGTVTPVEPGETFDRRDINITAMGQESLREFMKNYSQPFNVIVGGEVDLAAGDPIPTGRLNAVVHVDAHAGI
jgi:hypothetical protein